jgi:hypothetical protein
MQVCLCGTFHGMKSVCEVVQMPYVFCTDFESCPMKGPCK